MQGERIRAAAETAGLSLEELAHQIGCSRALMYQYVSGTTLAQTDKLQKIATAVGVTLAYFFGADGETAPPATAAPPVAAAVPSSDIGREEVVQSLEHLKQLAEAQAAPPDWKAHISTCEQIVPLARELGERQTEANALMQIGNAHLQLGDYHSARRPLERALDVYTAAQLTTAASYCRQSLGHLWLAQGDTAAARSEFEQLSTASDWTLKWRGLVSLAAVAEWEGDYAEAMRLLDSTESVIDEMCAAMDVGVPRSYVQANRVNIYLGCGDFAPAARLASEALSHAELTGAADQYMEALLSLTVAQLGAADWVKALDGAQRAVVVARVTGDRSREGVASSIMADVLTASGGFIEAKPYAKNGLAIALASGSARNEIFAHHTLGDVYLKAGVLDEALYHFERAHQQATEVKMRAQVVAAFQRMVAARFELGEIETATGPAGEALTLATNLGARHVEADAHLLLARIHWRAGDREACHASATAAHDIATQTPMPDRQVSALHHLALSASDDAAAEQTFAEAVALIQSLRKAVGDGGREDTVLEDPERAQVVTDYAAFLRQHGHQDRVASLIAELDWPPFDSLREAPQS